MFLFNLLLEQCNGRLINKYLESYKSDLKNVNSMQIKVRIKQLIKIYFAPASVRQASKWLLYPCAVIRQDRRQVGVPIINV